MNCSRSVIPVLCYSIFMASTVTKINPEQKEKGSLTWMRKQTVSGSKICCKWMHLTINSMWVSNQSTQLPHLQSNNCRIDPNSECFQWLLIIILFTWKGSRIGFLWHLKHKKKKKEDKYKPNLWEKKRKKRKRKISTPCFVIVALSVSLLLLIQGTGKNQKRLFCLDYKYKNDEVFLSLYHAPWSDQSEQELLLELNLVDLT